WELNEDGTNRHFSPPASAVGSALPFHLRGAGAGVFRQRSTPWASSGSLFPPAPGPAGQRARAPETDAQRQAASPTTCWAEPSADWHAARACGYDRRRASTAAP